MTTPRARRMLALVDELLLLPRSLTGHGVRDTLDRLGRSLDLAVTEVPSGGPALDWTVPPEWNLRRATLTAPDGRVVADTDVHPLHVVGYSTPVDTDLDLEALQPHLHSLPDLPDAIPFRTSYYHPTWGFCLADRVRRRLAPGTYHARVDATLAPGSLTYAEHVVAGTTDREVLVTAHTCHPGMANDNLSALAVASELARELAGRRTRSTYRFLFAPGTIGALTWLERNRERVGRIHAGMVLAGVGDAGGIHVKRTRRGDTTIDRALRVVLRDRGRGPDAIVDFSPWGYDERQFNSPGFDLPVALVMRTPHGTYPEYHTSLDDTSFVSAEGLEDSVETLLEVVDVLEGDRRYRNTHPYGEPQLGARGLYPTIGGRDADLHVRAMLWTLNLSDGHHDLVDVAERSGLAFPRIRAAADALAAADLLEEVTT